jgi:hypothetical protein
MAKRNNSTTSKRKPRTSGGTPSKGDRTKLPYRQIPQELTENEDPPLDLEPDGIHGRISTRISDQTPNSTMANKRNASRTSKRKPRTSGGTPRNGERTKLPRRQNPQESTENEQPPLDIEPYDNPGRKSTQNKFGTRYDALCSNDNEKDEEESDNATIEMDTEEIPSPSPPPKRTAEGPKSTTTARTPYGLLHIEFSDTEEEDNVEIEHDSIADEDDDEDDGDFSIPTTGLEEDIARPLFGLDPIEPDEIHKLERDRYRDLQDVTKQLLYSKPSYDESAASDDNMSCDTHRSVVIIQETPPDKAIDGEARNRTHQSYSAAAASVMNKPNNDERSQAGVPARSTAPTQAIRFSIRIATPPHANPLEPIFKALKHTLTVVQSVFHGKIGIAVWNPEAAGRGTDTIWKPKNLPDGSNSQKDKAFLQQYCDHWMNGYPNKAYVAFLKIRFVNDAPSTQLSFPLDQIGQQLCTTLAECEDETKFTKISLSRNPLACQAVKSITVGWLFGSLKSMQESTLETAIRKELNMPPEIPMGIRWKVIRNSQKANPPYNKDGPAQPQALTIELDEQWYNVYAAELARIFKKKSKVRICGIQFRLVPCFTSPRMSACDDATKTDATMMASKQQYFVNEHAKKLPPTSFIEFLDLPITSTSDNNGWTLRRHLMKASPKGRPSQRLFVTVDQRYNGTGHQLITTRTYYDEAERALNNMIPECLNLYGQPAAKWFTTAGLQAFKDITWDPNSNKTVSSNNEILDCLEEDFMGMGNDWRENSTVGTARRDLLTTHTTPVAASLNPSAYATTASEVINKRQLETTKRSDNSIKSFGDKIFDRAHDGDTVYTVIQENSPESITPAATTVQIDLTGMELQHRNTSTEDDTLSMSTMAHTTESTRRRLRDSDKQKSILEQENEQQAIELEEKERDNDALQQANALMMAQLDMLQKRMAMLEKNATPGANNTPRRHVTISTAQEEPSATRDGEPTDTGVAGIGGKT